MQVCSSREYLLHASVKGIAFRVNDADQQITSGSVSACPEPGHFSICSTCFSVHTMQAVPVQRAEGQGSQEEGGDQSRWLQSDLCLGGALRHVYCYCCETAHFPCICGLLRFMRMHNRACDGGVPQCCSRFTASGMPARLLSRHRACWDVSIASSVNNLERWVYCL